jgi:hypothetical protein
VVRGGREALAALATLVTDGAVVERADAGRLPPLAGAPAAPRPARAAAVSPNRLEVDVDAPAPGLLVVNEVFDPYWRAAVDGRAAPVLRANYLLRGVPVPAGRHRVALVYRPWPFLAALPQFFLVWAAVWRYGGK